MKNKNIFLLVLPILFSCGGNKPETLDLVATLQELKEGVKIEVVGVEKYDDNEKTYYLTNTSKQKEFSFILYKDETKTVKSLYEYYTYGDDEYIRQTRLNINNDYNLYKVYNPASSEYYKWSEGYDNVFTLLEKTDFIKDNDTKYSLIDTKLEEVSPYLSTLFYGNPGIEFTSFNISLENKELVFDATAVFKGTSTYNYTFDAKVVSKGSSVKMDYRHNKFEDVEDEIFDKMVQDLKTNNYTATIVNDDGFNRVEYICLSNEDKIYYESDAGKIGWYVNSNGLVQEVEKVGKNFYKSGSAVEGDIAEVMPTFDFAREVFDKEGNTYTLKPKVEGYMDTFFLLEAYADELDEFTIEIMQDGYKLTNVLFDATTTVTFTNIGTTNVGFSENSVL